MRRFVVPILALAFVAAPALPAAAQHGKPEAHLPPVQRNVEVVGKLDLFGNNEEPGRISDVAAFGDYAYLGAYAEPNCEGGGVYVVDVSKPSDPKEVDFIPTSDPTSFVGEGLQVLNMNTQFYKGPLLLYSQETCLPHGSPVLGSDPRLGAAGPGGATLVDVRDPLNWEKVADHVGDEDPPPAGGIPSGIPHNSHSVFGWQQGDKAYMVVMDNGETLDIDIFDITNPAAPVFVLETGIDHFPDIMEDPSPNGTSPSIHDFVVKKVGDKWLFLGSYWDGGYIILDFTRLPFETTFLRDTDFGPVEPFTQELRLPANTPPEGNAHQAEFSPDSSMFIGTDEDFNSSRFLGTITSGTYEGDAFTGAPGNATPPIPDGLSGPTVFVGYGCPMPPPPTQDTHIAIAERGSNLPGNSCPFLAKVQAAEAAGYKAIVIYNDRVTDANCDSLANMLAAGNIPAMFVGRSTGLKLLNTAPGPDSCDTPTPALAPGTPAQTFRMSTLFDGWGYMHLYDANTMQALDHWALPEGLDPANATGKGDLTVHEVAMDPTQNRAYISHYGGGFRVLDFTRAGGIKEFGAYIDKGGNNIWGVEVHNLGGRTGQVVLASDRDSGLYIFKVRPGVGIKRCAKQPTTLLGTGRRDRIKGTNGPDTIFAGRKKDKIRTGGGRDTVCGGRANDKLSGGKGRDLLRGGRGRDILVGGPGKGDVCRGGKGRDRFRGCENERG